MDWEGIAECCSPCCYKKKPSEVPYKTPKEALASVVTPDMMEGVPMTKSIHLQQPSEKRHSSPKASSDVMVITQQPKIQEEGVVSSLHPSSLRRSVSPSPPSTSSTSEVHSILPVRSSSTSFENLRIQSPSFQMAVNYYPEKQQLCIHSVSYQLQGAREPGDGGNVDDMHTFLVLQVQPNVQAKLHSKVKTEAESRIDQDEVFLFPGVPAMEVRYKTITVHIYKKLTTGQQELVGEVSYPLAEADITGTITLLPIKFAERTFQPDEKPEILLSLSYNEPERKLHGLILKAKNVLLPNASTSEHVSALVLLKEIEKKGSKKWQSSGTFSAPNPVFNQKFHFHLSRDTQLQNVELTVVLLTAVKGPSTRGDPVGMVRLSATASEADAAKLWGMVQSSPNQQNSSWLHLGPCVVSVTPSPTSSSLSADTSA